MEETQIRKYFLGGLTEAEHEDFDRWLMTGRDSVELVEEYEDRLIDDYVHGALSAEDRPLFESHFLSTPRRLRKLRLINSLIDESARATGEERGRRASDWAILPFALQPQSWIARAAFASVAATLLFGGAWLAFRNWSSHKQDGQLQAGQTGKAQPTPQQPAANKQELADLERQPRQSPSSPAPQTRRMVALSFTLSPGRVRDEEGTNPLRIPPSTDLVRLMLELEGDDYKTYRARLLRADGRVLWQKTLRSNKKTGGPVVALIPARLLVDGEYTLSLSGLSPEGAAEEVGTYYFKVTAR